MTNSNKEPQKIYLKDYTPPVYRVEDIYLDIKVFDDHATVSSVLNMHREHDGELILLGRELELLNISINDKVLTADDYTLDSESLTIHNAPDAAKVAIDVKINPQTNTALEGLYQSGTGDELMFVTQCEPEGFRKITFFPDRPDVLTEYTTRVEADKRFPVLLANGNLIEKGNVGDDRHFAVWHDPTKKPSYLFACVVADLAVMSDHYTTSEGREVLLEIYAVSADIDKCHVAMTALKDSMKWDEEHYGRAYDLDRYMIVATGQFNMGAMENKGLNIFNTSCVLSSPKTTTDERSFHVKAVIAHEYFHNWTGNRITCRDWFQLCLKEGFTVFRDQSFSASHRSPAVQRIDDVGFLKAHQFKEDAGVLAHPVRPDSFVEINNFYTVTVYEKGAEIVRMIATLLGKDKFRQGTDEYFARYDGQAVTIEDFLSAMSVGDSRVQDFLAWYTQAGTPVLTGGFDVVGDSIKLTFSQQTRYVAGFDEPKALPIPIDVAIFHGESGELLAQELLLLNKDSDTFSFDGLDLGGVRPVVPVLRNFSAPVKLEFDYTDEDLVKIVQFDNEGFNQWQAVQTLVGRLLFGKSDNVALLTDTLKRIVPTLMHKDPMLTARLFDVPSESELAVAYDKDYDPQAVKATRTALKEQIAHALADHVQVWYDALPIVPYQDTPDARGVRLLRNVLLNLALTAKLDMTERAERQYTNATCMSEQLGALGAMIEFGLPNADDYTAQFYEEYHDNDLVIDSWFSVQAGADSRDVAFIKVLMERADYDWQTPNRVRTTLGGLASKPTQLWTKDGISLYLSAVARLDVINPVLASRSLSALARWYTLSGDDKEMVKAELVALQQKASSKNVLEFLNNMLGDKA
ncbi:MULTISPECIES: aminopeptidase N [Moraxella]|uniref:Aminopeptidase N n=1 Tax=Moraxella lacunata TaxID=477 RepID=A0A1B8Q3L8_MORLA|nr:MULTISPECIES: aminopeptidase N [Moraxella]MBE9579032.1 aminopeptidase N [Moraxella sp. K1664]MBE9588377.1 aminopeptidase N [Moraxella sp. K1630]MBE9596434.1 aminopeptidase N [Moraxella sp. K2450]MDH9218920.1 aminopeptidase N [Moraxella lacunata]MDI4482988.1 aminopeptidase N [Moraxella lacunata]